MAILLSKQQRKILIAIITLLTNVPYVRMQSTKKKTEILISTALKQLLAHVTKMNINTPA